MSDAAVIHAVFEEIFGEKANFYEFDDRLKAQKAVFLLHELGVTCGDYSFRWYKFGPYSQQLQNTLLVDYANDENITLSEKGLDAIRKVKEMIQTPHDPSYSPEQWLEAIGSIRYLIAYCYQPSAKDEVLEKLCEFKPYLSNKDLNLRAYETLEKYFDN